MPTGNGSSQVYLRVTHAIQIFHDRSLFQKQHDTMMHGPLVLLTCFAIAKCQHFSITENPGPGLDLDSKQDRVPLYAPDRCPENQLLYPGDHKTDWICDCGPGFIYYPPKNGCFSAYRRGPCPKNQHLIIEKNKVVPECVTNPCKDGHARYKGRCYELGKPNGPCPPIEAGGGIFDVNATTLVVECLKGTDRLSLFDIPKNCPPGSIRDSNNRCHENWNVNDDGTNNKNSEINS